MSTSTDRRPDVLDAWRRLRTVAKRHGIELCLRDGKRSLHQRRREFAEAVLRFGITEQAARYVLPPGKSSHVKGIAVDVQPPDAAGWVERAGRTLGCAAGRWPTGSGSRAGTGAVVGSRWR